MIFVPLTFLFNLFFFEGRARETVGFSGAQIFFRAFRLMKPLPREIGSPTLTPPFVLHMHYVYVIKSLHSSFIYIGQTDDLRQRFRQHNAGTEIATKRYLPFMLSYYEAYSNKRDALIREKKLKQYGSSWGHLKNRLQYSLLWKPKGGVNKTVQRRSL